jgi:hypothetical protein
MVPKVVASSNLGLALANAFGVISLRFQTAALPAIALGRSTLIPSFLSLR